MTPHDFASTAAWTRRREEVRLEILAVCLPIVIYTVTIATWNFAQTTENSSEVRMNALSHLLGLPDGLFGGCILFAFAMIQAYRHREAVGIAEHAAFAKISRLRVWSFAGLIVCVILAGIAVITHPVWALPGGLVTIYFGGLAYKWVAFCRDYLRSYIHRMQCCP